MGNSFLKILLDDTERQLNLLLEELIHLSFVVRFFKQSISNRELFWKLNKFVKTIFIDIFGEDDESKRNSILYLWEKIRKTELEKRDFRGNIDESKAIGLFSDFVYIKTKINDVLLDKFDFIQQKLLSYQSGYQNYYPSPKITSIKEATKIHFFMEKITSEFCKLITEQENFEDKTLFYWDYKPEILFKTEIKDFLVINTDFSLPYRQPHWILLLHEVLHHIFISMNNHKDINSEFKSMMQDMEENINRAVNDCKRALIKSVKLDNLIAIDFNVISDIFIDSLLTYTFGIKYLLPATVRLFAYDENSFFFADREKWIIRLKSIIEVFKIKWGSENKVFIRDLETLLEIYLKSQIGLTNGIIRDDFFVVESVIEKTVLYRVKEFVRKHSKFLNSKFKEIESEEYKFLNAYLKYCDEFSEQYLKAIESYSKNGDSLKKEGRAICYAFQTISDRNVKSGEVESLIKKGFELDVFRITMFKLRFDNFHENKKDDGFSFEQFFKDWKNHCKYKDNLKNTHGNSFALLSPFTVMVIDKESINQKKHAFDKRYEIEKLLRKVLKLNNEKNKEGSSNNPKEQKENGEMPYSYAFANFLLEKKCYFYKEELTLTLFETDDTKKKELKSILGCVNDKNSNSNKDDFKASDSVAILIKMRKKQGKNIEIDNLKKESLIDKLKKKILNSINGDSNKNKNDDSNKNKFESKIFIFSSFDWFDYCALLFIKAKEENKANEENKAKEENPSIDLGEILKNIKRNFILKNELVSRTETTVGVGINILDKVKAPDVAVLLRMSGENLGDGYKFINEHKSNENFILSSSFGIRDLVIQIPGIKPDKKGRSVNELFEKIDNIIKGVIVKGSSKEYINFSDIQIEPYIKWTDEKTEIENDNVLSSNKS